MPHQPTLSFAVAVERQGKTATGVRRLARQRRDPATRASRRYSATAMNPAAQPTVEALMVVAAKAMAVARAARNAVQPGAGQAQDLLRLGRDRRSDQRLALVASAHPGDSRARIAHRPAAFLLPERVARRDRHRDCGSRAASCSTSIRAMARPTDSSPAWGRDRRCRDEVEQEYQTPAANTKENTRGDEVQPVPAEIARNRCRCAAACR